MLPRLFNTWLPLIGAAALWLPAMTAASYVWGHGEYYDYGWFVPPAALWLMVRRWKGLDGPLSLPRGWVLLALAAVLVPWIWVLRVLGYADPSWRLPILLLGGTAALASHALIATTRGLRVSAGFVGITLLWMSALPWPTVVETHIVHQLTQGVVTSVAEWFQMLGKPVLVLGDRLRLHELTVEVTDGCSGVRSFQSFVMATWFFAELQRLRAGRTLVLLACACAVAFGVNMARTYALASIRFEYGESAFARAHDGLGLLAFLVSGLFFYLFSGWLSSGPRRTVVRTVRNR
jgi:exosortase